jgi:hypothetical protein
VKKKQAGRRLETRAADYQEASNRFAHIELDLAMTFCEFGLVTADKKVARRNAENAHKALSTVEKIVARVTLGSSDQKAIAEKITRLERLLSQLERDLQSL